MPENWLKRLLTRLLPTGIGQILLITLWMQFPGQEAAGYLFLLITICDSNWDDFKLDNKSVNNQSNRAHSV